MSVLDIDDSGCPQCKAGKATEHLRIGRKIQGQFKSFLRYTHLWLCQSCAYWLLKTNPNAERVPERSGG